MDATAIDTAGSAAAGTRPAGHPNVSARLRALYLIFAISGFCGLIYESIWAKYLKLFLGHAAYAQTVVLVVFIGGMAVGAWLCARFTHRIRDPLTAYAIVELFVGLFAIRFHANFVALTNWGYSTLLPATCDASTFCISSWVLATVLILPQSILLGMTFPLMTAALLRAYPDGPGRKLSMLYFLNSFGAVFGVLASTFVLVPWVGLPGATLTAGLMNAGLAVVVYLLGRTQDAPPVPFAMNTRADADGGLHTRWLIAIAFITGLSSFIYEIVWIRMLALVLGSSTDAFELMLASFILGLALGGLWIRSRIDTNADPVRLLGTVQILMGLLALATIPFYNYAFDAMAWMLAALAPRDSGYLLFNVGSSLISMAMMLPATFMAGMTLPLITYLLMRRSAGERGIGIIYSANTFGSIAGVLMCIHIGLPLLGAPNSLKFACLVDVVLGVAILLMAKQGRDVALRWVALASVVSVVGVLTLTVDPLRTASGVYRLGSATLSAGEKVAFHRDGKTATVDIVRNSLDIVSIRTNGKTDAAIQMGPPGSAPNIDEFTMALLAALPLAHKPEIATAAAIGFGSGLTTAMLLASPNVKSVDTIEIEPAIVEGARAFLPRVERAYSDPRSRIIFDDAKSFFARSKGRYDLIVSEPSNPWVSGISSLFTVEFYSRTRDYLNPGGLFVQWIQGYEFNPALLASIMGAMSRAFPDFVTYYNGTDLLIVAARDGKVGEPSARLFEWKPMKDELARIGIGSLRDLRIRRVAARRSLERLLSGERAPVNSDYFPYVDTVATRARFKHETAALVLTLADAPIPVVEIIERWPAGTEEQALPPADPAFLRQSMARQADDLVGLLTSLRPASSDTLPSGVDPVLVAAYRMALVDCVGPQNTAALWDQIVQLGEITGSAGSAASGAQIWRRAEESQCLSKLPGYYRQWISLLRSVCERDPVRMEQLAESLLEYPDKTVRQIEYLVLASVTGAIAQGKMQQARTTLNEAFTAIAPDRQRLPWFQLVRSIAPK